MDLAILTTLLIFSFFYFIHWSAKKFELTEFAVRDCSSIGREPLSNVTECQEAAAELGQTYDGDVSFSWNPKGCFSLGNKRVFWNNHDTGSERKGILAICRKKGKYIY